MAYPSWLPLGLALRDHLEGAERVRVRVHTHDGDITYYPAELFFRDYDDFSIMDERGCMEARGHILDGGAGAGAIALFLQDEMGHLVTAMDISPHCVEIMERLGVEDPRQGSIFDLQDEQFDTILLLMNGIGFVGNLEGLDQFLEHAKSLLAPGGQVLFDSSDLKFADIDGADLRGNESQYFGEVWYQLEYKGMKGKPYYWLYLDPVTAREYAEKHGYRFEILEEAGEGYYFARLTHGPEASA